jgi:hypothetical protein
MNSYASGSEVDLEFTFRDKLGNLDDPTDATFSVEDGEGNVTEYPLSAAARLSLGVYELTIVVSNPSSATVRWYYRGQGTAGLICATPDEGFYVLPTRF